MATPDPGIYLPSSDGTAWVQLGKGTVVVPGFPAPPTNLRVTSTAPTSVSLAWDVSPRATGYEVSVNSTTSFVSVGTARVFTVTGLAPNTAYIFRVRAKPVDPAAPASASVSATTSLNPAAPATPPNFRLVSSTATSAVIAWDAVAGATSYQVATGAGAYSGVGTVVSTTITGLVAGTPTVLHVRAVNSFGTSVPANLTVTTGGPATPGNFRQTGVTDMTATLAWNAVAGAIRYELATDTGAYSSLGTALTANMTSLSAGTTYTFHVRVVTAAGTSPSADLAVTTTGGVVVPALIGMSAEGSESLWDQRRLMIEGSNHQNGSIRAYRWFFTSADNFAGSKRASVEARVAQGYYPIISFKLPAGVSWAQCAAGAVDSTLASTHTWLASLNTEVFVCIHHEPGTNNDPSQGESGTPADHAAMDIHALPILKGGLPRIKVGMIGNGYWFHPTNAGSRASDAELLAWMPANWANIADVAAFDTYQGGSDLASGGPDITDYNRNMVAWAQRRGDIKGLGLGEFNAFEPSYFTNLLRYVKTQPLYRWICLWNNINARAGYLGEPATDPGNARLIAFQNELRVWPS